MSRTTLLLLLVFTTASASAQTTDVKFNYQDDDKKLTVSGTLCTYGKKSKQALPQAVVKHIHEHVKNQHENFITQIKNIKTGMFGRRLDTAELAVIYQLTEQHLDMAYFFEGNNACVEYQANLELDYSRDASSYFNFAQPSTWTFLAKRNDLVNINQVIKTIYPNITLTEIDLTSESKSSLVELSKVSDSFALYKFDAQTYQAAKASLLNTVFVNAPAPYKSAMQDYLTSYQFSVSDNAKQANWYLHVIPKKTEQGVLFRVSYQSKTSVNKVITNDPSALPMLPNGDEQALKNIITLHLEMMEFIELLNSK